MNLNIYSVIRKRSCRDNMSKLGCISLEDATAEVSEVSGGEFVARHLPLMPPLVTIDGEDPISEQTFQHIVVERPLQKITTDFIISYY